MASLPITANPSRSASQPVSAGLLIYRSAGASAEFLLVHPGGPYWRGRDDGAWMVPKGLIEPGEDPLAAARREFTEETGLSVDGPFDPLTPIRQKAGKRVLCWIAKADLDLAAFRSNHFDMEWPAGSGRILTVPECDRAAYFEPSIALRKILASQRPLLTEAIDRLAIAKDQGDAARST